MRAKIFIYGGETILEYDLPSTADGHPLIPATGDIVVIVGRTATVTGSRWNYDEDIVVVFSVLYPQRRCSWFLAEEDTNRQCIRDEHHSFGHDFGVKRKG